MSGAFSAARVLRVPHLIGKEAFRKSGASEIHIPDSAEELCHECFCLSWV